MIVEEKIMTFKVIYLHIDTYNLLSNFFILFYITNDL